MSRTKRKHQQSFEEYYKDWLCETNPEQWKIDHINHERVRYNTDSDIKYEFGVPKWFRQMINKSRRSRDRFQLWKELKLLEEDYKGNYSPYNCKDANTWSYW